MENAKIGSIVRLKTSFASDEFNNDEFTVAEIISEPVFKIIKYSENKFVEYYLPASCFEIISKS